MSGAGITSWNFDTYKDVHNILGTYQELCDKLVLANQKLAATQAILAKITVVNTINEIVLQFGGPGSSASTLLDLLEHLGTAAAVEANLAALETALSTAIVTPAQNSLNSFVAKYQTFLQSHGINV